MMETPEIKKFVNRLKEHIIGILKRNKDEKTQQMLQMSKMTFHDFLRDQVPDVYKKAPHSGFQNPDEKSQPITVEQYFDIIFTEIEEKLATSV